MNYVLWNNDLGTWLVAATIALAVCVGLDAAKRILVRRLSAYAARTETTMDDLALRIISATHAVFILAMGLYAGAQLLTLTDRTAALLAKLAIAALLLQAARWGDVGVHGWLHFYRIRRSAEDAASTTSTAALGFVARTALWLVIVLMILDNFGVNITTLIASLGIGGIAVALALQNILGDLFSSL